MRARLLKYQYLLLANCGMLQQGNPKRHLTISTEHINAEVALDERKGVKNCIECHEKIVILRATGGILILIFTNIIQNHLESTTRKIALHNLSDNNSSNNNSVSQQSAKAPRSSQTPASSARRTSLPPNSKPWK